MDFRYLPFDGAPPPPIYPSTQRFSYAPLPLLPPPPPSDHGYFYSRPFRGMLPRGEEYERERTREEVVREEVLREVLRRGHYSFLPYRPLKGPFLEREYERERIREEVLREEVRRRIIEEEVRWELAMERYYNLRHSNPSYHGTWTNVQFEQPRFSHGCQTGGPRSQVPNKHSRANWGLGEVQQKIMEIDDKELMSKTLVTSNKVKPSNKKENQKKKDKQTIQTEANGNKTHVLQQMPTLTALGSDLPYPLLSGPHQKGQQELLKVAGTCGSKRKGDSISALLTPAATRSSSNKVGPKNVKKQKVDRKEYSCTSCQLTIYDNPTWLVHLNGKRHQNKLKNIANVETSKKELLKVAETRGSKRKGDSISALPTPAATRNSGYEAYRRIVKKQKVHKKECRFLRGKKEYNCTFCQLTVNTGQQWLFHLNGKKHRRNTLEKLTNVDMTKKASSDSDNKSTLGIALLVVKVEMDNGDSLATKPTEELQTDKGIIKNKVEFLSLLRKTRRGRRGRRNINSKI